MKKSILVLLSIIVFSSTICTAYSKSRMSTELADAIKLYKAQNYSECYVMLEEILKEDNANVLAHYYMAITSAQIGKKEEALANYEKVLILSPENNNLNRYAKKGKRCIETPDKCEESLYDSLEDEFIQKRFGKSFSDNVQSDYERLKLENFMREMNRTEDVEGQKFNEFRDFSSSSEVSNDEIVAALRTLQKAGLSNVLNNNYNMDLSVLTGNSQQNSMYNMFGNTSMSPQLIQALLTNNMAQGF